MSLLGVSGWRAHQRHVLEVTVKHVIVAGWPSEIEAWCQEQGLSTRAVVAAYPGRDLRGFSARAVVLLPGWWTWSDEWRRRMEMSFYLAVEGHRIAA